MDDARLKLLRTHAGRLTHSGIAQLTQLDPARADDFALRVGPVYANFARQRYDREALAALFAIAENSDVQGALRALFDGAPVNTTEARPALHTALRSTLSTTAVAREAHAQACKARETMRDLVEALHATDVTDIVSVGIGGSDLGSLGGGRPGGYRPVALARAFPVERGWTGGAARAGRPRPQAHGSGADLEEFRHPGNPAERRDPAGLAGR